MGTKVLYISIDKKMGTALGDYLFDKLKSNTKTDAKKLNVKNLNTIKLFSYYIYLIQLPDAIMKSIKFSTIDSMSKLA